MLKAVPSELVVKMVSGFDSEAIGDVVAQRADVLACLAARPRHNRDLQDDLGISRSTAYKALRELEEHSLCERTDEGFALTLTGRLTIDQYEKFREGIDAICVPGPLLKVLPADAIESLDVLHGAAVIFAERHAPNLPVSAIEDVVRDAETLRGMSPVLLPLYVELFHECIVDNKLDVSLLLEAPVVDHLVDQYRQALDDVVDTGHAQIWKTDETLPFGLIVVERPDPQVALIVYDAGGELRGVITNDTQGAVDWGKDVWLRYQTASQAVGSEEAE